MEIINDFFSNRIYFVEVDGTKSAKVSLDVGCVQGSVLGPKLFSLYTRKIEELAEICKDPHSKISTITYADDTYVVIEQTPGRDIKALVESTLETHCQILEGLGMVVNHAKTEVMAVGGTNVSEISFKGTTIPVDCRMKALGIIFDKNLTWEFQVVQVLAKSRGLMSTMRFLQKLLARYEFLRAMTPSYYGMCYYGSPVWLPVCRSSDL